MSKEREDTLYTKLTRVAGQVVQGPKGPGNQETPGEDRGWVYWMPNFVSDQTPTSQAPRVMVGGDRMKGPFGAEDHTHRWCINGTAIEAEMDENGNFFNAWIHPRDTGPETMGRGGAQGENTHLLNSKPVTRG